MKVEEEVDSLKIIRIFLTEVAQAGQVETIDKITSIDMVDEANMVFGGPPGREGLKAHVKSFRRDIADLKIDIKDIVGNQKKVMAHWSFEVVTMVHGLASRRRRRRCLVRFSVSLRLRMDSSVTIVSGSVLTLIVLLFSTLLILQYIFSETTVDLNTENISF